MLDWKVEREDVDDEVDEVAAAADDEVLVDLGLGGAELELLEEEVVIDELVEVKVMEVVEGVLLVVVAGVVDATEGVEEEEGGLPIFALGVLVLRMVLVSCATFGLTGVAVEEIFGLTTAWTCC